MKNQEETRELNLDQMKYVSGGISPLVRYVPGRGQFTNEAKDFFRQCVGDEMYARAMNSEAGRRHHYVVARAFLNQADWEKFMWIEQYGSLEGYQE